MAQSTIVAPRMIPQEVQDDIVALAVLEKRLDEIVAAYDNKKDEIAAALVALVRVR